MIAEDRRYNLNINEAFYSPGVGVSSPLDEEFLIRSEGLLAAIDFFIRDTTIEVATQKEGMKYRPRRNLRLYWPIPGGYSFGEPLPTGMTFITDRGLFEEPLSVRRYQFSRGVIVVDSVKSNNLYTTLDATFRNLLGDTLRVEGIVRFEHRKQFKFADTYYKRL